MELSREDVVSCPKCAGGNKGGTAPETRVPIVVRDDVTTFEAKVVPVSDSAGAEPVMLIE